MRTAQVYVCPLNKSGAFGNRRPEIMRKKLYLVQHEEIESQGRRIGLGRYISAVQSGLLVQTH